MFPVGGQYCKVKAKFIGEQNLNAHSLNIYFLIMDKTKNVFIAR